MYLIDEAVDGLSAAPAASRSERDQFLTDVIDGLGASPKTLPCKWFYDERGSQLFDDICDLPEYYPTRTELGIMEREAESIASHFSAGDVLVELGSGSSVKTRILLDHLPHLGAYVPVDISSDHLAATADRLRALYPSLNILPVAADYTERFAIPLGSGNRVMVYFPGSTIGNFHPDEALLFLQRIRALCGSDGGLLIGVDLQKPIDVLEQAYDDAAGVTAEFNLNILRRMRRELDADIEPECFTHRAVYNTEFGRIEMHLVSKRAQTVRVGGRSFHFAEGETIWTECSYKHTLAGFEQVAIDAGFQVEKVWTDPKQWFSVQMLRAV